MFCVLSPFLVRCSFKGKWAFAGENCGRSMVHKWEINSETASNI